MSQGKTKKGLPDKSKKIQWHPAFYAVAELELKENIEELDLISEYHLSKEPIRIILFPVQIVVISRLNRAMHSSLRILSANADIEDIREFLEQTENMKSPRERNNIDAVLQASVSANYEIYQKVRRADGMCEALRELMKDEIEQDVAKGRAEEIVEMGYEFGLSESAILERLQKKLNISLQTAQEYLQTFGKQIVKNEI